MDAQSYLDAIKLKMATSAMVRQVDIMQECVAGDDGCLRARLVLTNDDFLEVSEFFTVEQGQGQTIEYRHQWIDQTRQVILHSPAMMTPPQPWLLPHALMGHIKVAPAEQVCAPMDSSSFPDDLAHVARKN